MSAAGNSHLIAGCATCKLCSRKFHGPTAALLATGRPQHATRMVEYAAQLQRHLQEAHADEWSQAQLSAMEFGGLKMMSLFDITDQALLQQREFLRWHIHQMTLTASISDEALTEKARALAVAAVDLAKANLIIGEIEPAHIAPVTPVLINSTADIIHQALKELRDALQEPGKFPNAQAVLTRR